MDEIRHWADEIIFFFFPFFSFPKSNRSSLVLLSIHVKTGCTYLYSQKQAKPPTLGALFGLPKRPSNPTP